MSQFRRGSLGSVATPKRNRRRNRGATWLALVSVISCLVVGIGLYHQLSVGSGYGPWQDRVSILIRQIGFGQVLDRVDNWVYTRHAPCNSAPALHAPHVFCGASAADPNQEHAGLPTLSHNGIGSRRAAVPMIVNGSGGTYMVVYTVVVQPDRLHQSVSPHCAAPIGSVTAHLAAGTTHRIPLLQGRSRPNSRPA
jgi:hypothetical protein